MERIIQVKQKQKIGAALTGLFLIVSVFTGGCGNAGLEQPYNFAERSFQSVSEGGNHAAAFADGLCVVTDEGQFQDDSIHSEAAALFSLDDREVMFSKNAFERLYPASITKVMTALVAIKYGRLTDVVTVTDEAVITEAGASLCHIKPGDKLTMDQLLYGLMLPSGNDAGAAIAVHMAGSLEAFSDMMNEEAKKIGATGTHFMNP